MNIVPILLGIHVTIYNGVSIQREKNYFITAYELTTNKVSNPL